MTTEVGQAMKNLVAAVQPTFKEQGFKKRGHTFNRTTEPDGIVHVINFQMGAYNPPGSGEIPIPGLRPNLHGRFTVNLGAWLPGVAEIGFGTQPESARSFINEYNCQLRVRIGQLLPEPADTWWPLDTLSEQLAEIVTTALTGYGFPWLARFAHWDAIVAQLETVPPVPTWFMSVPRLTAMTMRLARGQCAEAEQDFAEHLDAYRRNPRNPQSHLNVLARIAEANSFSLGETSS